MTVNTRRVTGRRTLRYESLDDLLREAERLAATEVEMLGNWSLGQVLAHLAIGINGSIDGFTFRLTRVEMWFIRVFLKNRMLKRGFPPALGRDRRWSSVKPAETSTADGLAALRAAVARFKLETKRSPHPAFGQLSDAEWQQFHLRHAELHLSFAVPKW